MIRYVSERQFVDVNGRPVTITKRYKLEAEMNEVMMKFVCWEINTDTKPIIGMDSFDQLSLQLMQRKVQGNDSVHMEPVHKQTKPKRTAENALLKEMK